MAAVLTGVPVDDVEIALCVACSGVYEVRDGWQGSCPSCCALLDDHDAGRHDDVPVPDCRTCDDETVERLDLFAIA